MPIRTILAAATGAATGVIATVLYFNSRAGGFSAASQPPRTAAVHVPVAPPTFKADEQPLVDPAGLFQYGAGFPGPVSDLAKRSAYISSYDRRTRNPTWVVEHITPESVALNNADRKHSVFLEDESVPEKFRAKLKNYFRSGYDRGHQAPAADAKWSQTAMDETFYLTNMCPQVGDGFNRDYWSHFEDFCRRLTKKYPSVRIITGPLYLPRQYPDGKWRVSYEVIGNPPNVAVPTHFYKIVLGEDGTPGGKVAVGAFVLPNAEIHNSRKLTEFEVPVEMIERASGLEFLAELEQPRRKRLCGEVECSVVVRDFKRANQQQQQQPLRQ
ncbi:mitochondrial nuclease [Kalaharituber pfeilii]|nr:mitochondrial nuclease [Kalaharituber pfeilii]